MEISYALEAVNIRPKLETLFSVGKIRLYFTFFVHSLFAISNITSFEFYIMMIIFWLIGKTRLSFHLGAPEAVNIKTESPFFV